MHFKESQNDLLGKFQTNKTINLCCTAQEHTHIQIHNTFILIKENIEKYIIVTKISFFLCNWLKSIIQHGKTNVSKDKLLIHQCKIFITQLLIPLVYSSVNTNI